MDLHAEWLACMRRGDFPGAWAVSARVLAGQDPAARDAPWLPYHQRWVWDGRPFADRDVLVRCYHGLGDTLQFVRFLPLLRERAGSVTLECQPELLDLLQPMRGFARLVPFDAAAPTAPSTCDIEVMELAFALRASPERAPPPYLEVRAAPTPRNSVGLCWKAGNWDADRIVPPALLRPLAAGRPCVSLVPGPTDLPVLNPEGCPSAIADTAALIAGLDLIITVDTMVAHLAGALGRPTWLLLKHDADWRWMADRTDSPWYPSMRLYRQAAPGDWGGVIARVAEDLAHSRRPSASRAERGDP
jgi:hypothetical protein